MKVKVLHYINEIKSFIPIIEKKLKNSRFDKHKVNSHNLLKVQVISCKIL